MKHLLKWPLMCAWLSLTLAQSAPAAQDYYINDAAVANALNIDATNFVNNNSFSSLSFTPYETTSTRNFTNNGSMSGFGGFLFNTKIGGTRSMAANFYNPGTITVSSGGQLLVNVTNITSPGVMDVGLNGAIKMTGENVDLTLGGFIIQAGGSDVSASGVFGLEGAFGVNTNKNWDPGFELAPNYAFSSGPYFVGLINSQSYIKTTGPTSNLVVRAVFIQDDNGLSNNVYIGHNEAVPGSGRATIEWVGTSVDPASGITTTNYLYLNNDYVLGATTNVVLINGIPSNFTFTQGAKDPFLVLANPLTPSFTQFPSGMITNPYSYTLAQFEPSTAATGPTPGNPSGALTNLPGRIQISASRELNLSLATIAGMNYLSLTATNQYDGNEGATITAPYSDIDLGVTNGFMVVSNLLQSVIPVWGGTVQAWSTRWFFTDTNATYTGVTNGVVDFRVLIVRSSVYLGILPQIQDLTLHSTNVIISDQLNIIRNLSIDAKSLTLTSNGPGAGSLQGELNLQSANISFSSSLPNLRWLTNNGVISTLNGNPANFGSAPPNNYFTLINRGSIFNSGGTAIWASDFENSGVIYSGFSGLFALQSQRAVISGGPIIASGDVSITSGSLVASNLSLPSGRSLTLTVTNLLTDGGPPAGNDWYATGDSLVGLNLPIKPTIGDLLGTRMSVITPINANKKVVNTWAGQDLGIYNSGYTNNVAVGELFLSTGKAAPFAQLTFNGTGTSNAIYVDRLILAGSATSGWGVSNIPSLVINPNMVIYYAQALSNGVSVAQKINHWNTNRLRWVSGYAGYYSSTNMAFGGSTNAFNAALAQSSTLDSDGDGIANASDPAPFFLPSQVSFTATLTNVPPKKVLLKWQSFPTATNYVFYTTNLTTPNWQVLTNFVTPLPLSPPVTLSVLDTLNAASQRFYRVRIDSPQP